MKRLLTLAILGALAGSAGAVEIKTYQANLDVAAEGPSRARIELQLSDVKPGALLIPMAPSLKPTGEIAVISAPVGTQTRVVTVGERPHLEAVFPEGSSAEIPLVVEFPVKSPLLTPKPRSSGKKILPDGSLLLDHNFVNTQPYSIGSYRLGVSLPPETRVHSVREELPKPKRSEIEPRVGLDGKDGRQGAVLQLSGMKQGDRTSMSLEVVPDHRSLTWLLVGLGLSIAYLVGFRSLVTKPKS